MHDRDIAVPAYEGCERNRQRLDAARRGTGGSPGGACPIDSRFQRLAIAFVEAERVGEETNGLAVGRAAGATFEIADCPGAQAGPLGEGLLRESRRNPEPTQRIGEG